MNPLLDAQQISVFLNSFASKDRRRGKHSFLDHAVRDTSCRTTDSEYVALVAGSKTYTVVFKYNPTDRSWAAECDCTTRYFCKHAYAGMLALQANAAKLAAARPKSPAKVKRKPKDEPPIARAIPQPPSSELCVALLQAVGRPLNKTEIDYVERVQWVYGEIRAGISMRAEHLWRFSASVNDYSWTPLNLWPSRPRSDLELWLFCAWELRRRGLALPEPLLPVTDFSTIEPLLRDWQRRQEIDRWRALLRDPRVATAAESPPVDLRLMVLTREARLQWKTEFQEEFQDLTEVELRRRSEEHQLGTLVLNPDAAPMWLAFYQPFDSSVSCRLDYESAHAAKILVRILHLAALGDRLVDSDGTPLLRPAEALRYQLISAENAQEDYTLKLVLPDGADAPPVLLTAPGQPALYLTERALFKGPPPHGYGMRQPLHIPALALDTIHGVGFLSRLHIDLPPRLAARARPVRLTVQVKCEVRSIYTGSNTRGAFIEVSAHAHGSDRESYTSVGWQVTLNDKHTAAEPEADSDAPIPIIDRSPQRLFPGVMTSLGAKWDDMHRRWRVRLTKNFPETFVAWLKSLPPTLEVQLDSELATLRDLPVSGSVRLDIQEADVDWFDLKVALNVSDTQLTPEELKLLFNAGGQYVRLGEKGWRRLQFDLSPEEEERLARLGLDARDFSAEPQRLHALQLADDAARKFLPEHQVESIQRRAAELKTRVTPAVPEHISAQLRPYQIEGFHFLAYLTANHFGGVLADDMGLGKTLQALTWLEWLRQERKDAPSATLPGEPSVDGQPESASSAQPAAVPGLVVCPKSVMDNWRAEAERFCPGLRVRVWRGEEATVLEEARAESDLIVINYAQLRSLSPSIAQLRWHVAILDEAQYIKNPDSQTAQAARSLRAEHRLALSGTPIENRLLDLWSVFAFAMPGVLGNRAYFTRRFNQEDDPFARRRLAARVRPFLLRRTKGQVATDLPDRVEEDLLCEMEGEQKALYRAELKRAQQLLLNVQTQKELNEQRFHFLTSLLRLRQICCHPALVSEDLQKSESAKLNALLDLLEPVIDGGHKVLVFSQFVSMLEILREAVKQRDWPTFYLTGESEHRGELVREFQNAPGAAVFLISLKAGGFGLNLTAASYVVLFDPWWNPAVEMQAIDRTHRIGQTSKVMAYRLLMKDSIEQKIRQLQRTKAALADDVLGEEKFAQALTIDDLRYLLADE